MGLREQIGGRGYSFIWVKMKKRIMPARAVVPKIKTFTGILSKIGIILVIFYFASFSFVSQARAEMLPDSPLYFLKVARDSIVTSLISDPAKKSFYLLFLADKRLGAGEKLITKGKETLGLATLNRSEEYFVSAVDWAQKTTNEDLFAKLVVAGARHDKVLTKEKGDLTKARQLNAQSRKRAMELLLSQK